MSVSLVEFIRARLDEDEEVARATRRNEQFVYGTDRWFASHGNAITSMAPHRAVAEVAAKRQILDRHKQCGSGSGYCDDGGHGWNVGDGEAFTGCSDLVDLASPYSGHRDYRAEWAPDLA